MNLQIAALILFAVAAVVLAVGAYFEREAEIERMKERARKPVEPRLFTYHANTRPPARESSHGDPSKP